SPNAYQRPHPPLGASPGVEEFLSGLGGGGGVALIGARVTGVRVTPISGMSDSDGADRRGVYTRVGAGAVICSAEGGGGGGGASGGGGAIPVDRAGAGLEGAGPALVGLVGDTLVDSCTPAAEPRVRSRTPATTSAATVAPPAAVNTRFERYHGTAADALKSHAPLLDNLDSHDVVGGTPGRPLRGARMPVHWVPSGSSGLRCRGASRGGTARGGGSSSSRMASGWAASACGCHGAVSSGVTSARPYHPSSSGSSTPSSKSRSPRVLRSVTQQC
ncbi:MAG: hypothetical protein QOF88_3924, partial [Mycobacterium sp.]|nr:hypothetical protein [Mycobacterium sp.]